MDFVRKSPDQLDVIDSGFFRKLPQRRRRIIFPLLDMPLA